MNSGLQGCLFLPLLVSIVPEVLSSAMRPKKEASVIQIAKEEIKMSLFVDSIILYLVNTKESSKVSRIEEGIWQRHMIKAQYIIIILTLAISNQK